MKRKNKINRMAAFLAAMILTVFSLCHAAFAADTNATMREDANMDTDRPLSLNITLVRDTAEIAADRTATVRLYQVGEWDASQGKYVLTEAFADSNVVLDLDKAGDIREETIALRSYVAEKEIAPLASGRTQEGKYSFSDLSMGLYMVCSPSEEEAKEIGDNARLTAFLVTLPLWTVDDNTNIGGWVYDVSTSSKYENVPHNPGDDNPGGNDPGGNDPGGNNPGGNNPGGNNPGGNNPGGGGPRRDRTPSSGGPGDGTPIDDDGTPLGNLDDNPLENIEDEGVPLSDNPIKQIIEDVLVPLGLLPKTGDGSISYAPLLALMGASGLLIFALIRRRIKKAHS